MSRNGRSFLAHPGLGVVLLAVTALGPGCQNWVPLTPPPAPPPAPRSVENLDACSERLEQLCGRLMMYFAVHRQVPARLEDLGSTADPLPGDALSCPVSHKLYVYDPAGVRVIGLDGRLIVYDYDPSHAGLRWGILAVQLQPGQPAVCKVVRPRGDSIVWQEPLVPSPPPDRK